MVSARLQHGLLQCCRLRILFEKVVLLLSIRAWRTCSCLEISANLETIANGRHPAQVAGLRQPQKSMVTRTCLQSAAKWFSYQITNYSAERAVVPAAIVNEEPWRDTDGKLIQVRCPFTRSRVFICLTKLHYTQVGRASGKG